jgi:hypothetical protein
VDFTIIDLIGLAGGLLILFGFYRVSIGRWKGTSFWYELDNLAGAALLSAYSYSKMAYVSILLNAVWAFVAFVGISTYAERRAKKTKTKIKRVIKKQTKRW